MFEELTEQLKKTFLSDVMADKAKNKLSNDPDLLVKTKTLSDDPFGGAVVINQDRDEVDFGFGFSDGEDKHQHQARVIDSYRQLATNDEVSNGIDIIVNELIYTIDSDVFKIDIDEENEKISDVIHETFKKVLDLLNIKENIFVIGRQMYIDGQLNVSLSYNKSDIKSGIRTINIIEPKFLYFDHKDKLWKYADTQDASGQNLFQNSLYDTEIDKDKNSFSEAELVHVDYDLYTKVIKEQEYPYQINLGYLENVFKNANMLQTLENMLVPMRYSRSVSRRLFNIDVADLPPKQAKALMDKIREEFRYKKTFDPATGTVKNSKGVQPLVEDYWMSNRGGAKGTSVDTMDEKGSIMDLEDIQHAAKKLYTSMKIPTSRNPYSDDKMGFSFDDTQITQEELSFYIFISRLRIPVTTLIKEIMRRELIATGVFKDSEWKVYNEKIVIDFTAESTFIENMKKELFLKSVESFVNIKENIGQIISLQTAVENTFSWSSEQLTEELEKIEKEKENPLFVAFYDRDTENDADSGSWR